MTEEIEKRFQGLTCIAFSGEGCMGCLTLVPVLNSVLGGRKDIRLEQVEVSEDTKDIVTFFGVDRVPTVILADDGKEFARCHGYQPEEILELWIDAKIEEHFQEKK